MTRVQAEGGPGEGEPPLVFTPEFPGVGAEDSRMKTENHFFLAKGLFVSLLFLTDQSAVVRGGRGSLTNYGQDLLLFAWFHRGDTW